MGETHPYLEVITFERYRTNISIQQVKPILKRLMQQLAPAEFMSLQFTYAKVIHVESHGASRATNVLSKVVKAIPRVSYQLPSLIKRGIKKFLALKQDSSDREMQMN